MPVRVAFRLLKWLYRLVWLTAVVGSLVFAAAVLLLRYWLLPNIDSYRPLIVHSLSKASGQRLDIAHIEGEWDGLRPRLVLRDLRLLDADGAERLHLQQVDSTIAWLSLVYGELQLYAIELEHLHLDARRTLAGTVEIAGIPVNGNEAGSGGGMGDWLLRQHRIVVRDSEVVWTDEMLSGVPLQLTKVDIRVEQFFGTHRFAVRATPPEKLAMPIDVRGELHGRSFEHLERWHGRVYAVVGQADFAALRQWVRLPAPLIAATGGVQIWIDIAAGRPSALTADVALSDVRTRLQDDLPELTLTALRGRLGWRETQGSLELWARSLMFATPDGVRLPPADLSFARTSVKAGASERTEITFDSLDLEAVSRLLDRLPLPADVRTRLAELNPRGSVRDFHVVFQDRFDFDKAYTLRGGFRNVGWHASGYLPGASNVTGTLTANERGGSLDGTLIATQIDMPRIFVAPVPLQKGEFKVKWQMAAGLPRVAIERVALTSEHLNGVVTGTYDAMRDAPGSVNLRGTFPKASGQDVWRYIPLVVPAEVRDWLRQGIVAAAGRDVQFILRGDLRQFPFSVPNSGVFQVQALIDDGTVQFASDWPRMLGIRGRLSVNGNRLEVSATQARILGAQLKNLWVVIPDLSDHQAQLQARGDAEGPSNEFLRFLRESPLHERVGAFTSGMQAAGRGHLALTLDMPLLHASDTKVAGTYTFSDNTLVPGEGLPRVEQLSGHLEFTQDQLTARDGQGRIFGQPAQLSIATEPGALVRIQASGQIDAPALRRQFNSPLLSRVDGSTDWKLNAAVQPQRSEIVVESSLGGLSSNLPAPLAKSASQRLPLRIERREASRAQDLIVFSLGNVVAGQMLQDKSNGHIPRGEVAFGERAGAPQRDGVWLSGSIDRLDFDAWRDLAGDKSSGGEEQIVWGGLDIEARRLRAFSRDFADVSIDAQRSGTGWKVSLESAQVTGDIEWHPEGKGSMVGRFSHLELPAGGAEMDAAAPAVQAGAGKDLPSVDLTAEDFRVGARQFGSLALMASPSGQDWRIERLDLSTPDGTFSAKGVWQAWSASPRTQVEFKLDVNDIGRFFARMQLPKGIEGGKGRLEGSIAWAGPPYALDVPTLSGRLGLSAKKGRFVKVDPGIGKLLAVLSLQTIPKMVTFDLRDVFSQGFAFDEITANADVVHGLARTQDFNMKGAAARVEMRGEVDLAAETQQLDVRIFPSLSDSVALGTALVNPVIGLGALVVQKALKDPLSHILSFEYHIAGTWTTPSVLRKKREVPAGPQPGRK
jgi:uncharacterized protein (TIGR02099 family)